MAQVERIFALFKLVKVEVARSVAYANISLGLVMWDGCAHHRKCRAICPGFQVCWINRSPRARLRCTTAKSNVLSE